MAKIEYKKYKERKRPAVFLVHREDQKKRLIDIIATELSRSYSGRLVIQEQFVPKWPMTPGNESTFSSHQYSLIHLLSFFYWISHPWKNRERTLIRVETENIYDNLVTRAELVSDLRGLFLDTMLRKEFAYLIQQWRSYSSLE